MELTKSPVSERVRAALSDRSISGSALARALGLSQAYVSRRLRGAVPWRVRDLERIAQHIGVPVAELLADGPGPKPTGPTRPTPTHPPTRERAA